MTNGELTQAEAAASAEPDQSPQSPVLPCRQQKRQAIEVLVVDAIGVPLADIAVQLERGPGSVILQRTGGDGMTRFEKLLPGSYQLTLPATDEHAWEQLESHALDKPDSSGDAVWSSPPPTPESIAYTVQLGDCLASIAFSFGFLPDSLWNYGPNSHLNKESRRMRILHPEDIVNIPQLVHRRISVSTGQRYKLRRKGVPERLRLRFVNYRFQPRSGERYLIHLDSASGNPIPDRKGTLDSDGFIDVPIPPDATGGFVLLEDSQGEREEIEIDLGYVNPLEKTSGVKARLRNLHYAAGPGTEEVDEQTADAIREFQMRYGLPVTGEIDGAIRDKLHSLHRS